jgi:hypothetical protein
VKQKGKNAESVRKAATVILSLGVDSAAQMFKYLRPEEIEQITLQIATLDNLSSPTVESTMEEFYNHCPGMLCHIPKNTPHDFVAGKTGELLLFYSLVDS